MTISKKIFIYNFINKIINEEIAKLSYPKKTWSINKEFSREYFTKDFFRKEATKFRYEPNGIGIKHVKENDGMGLWYPTKAYKLFPNKITIPSGKAIVYLDLDNERFIIDTNLNDPRIVSVIKSTLETFSEFANYQISKVFYTDDPNDINELHPNQILHFKDFGTAKELLTSTKTIKGKSLIYQKNSTTEEMGPSFEEFELEVFNELSDENWFHATKLSNVDSILNKGLLPSTTFNQGTGWTQLNFNLQSAVYLTKNLDYAIAIAKTLATRHNEDSVVLEINGNILKNNYESIVIDEDSLRSDFDGEVKLSFSEKSFLYNKERLPEFITSVVDNIESIGYKSSIKPQYISVNQIIKSEPEED